jgi:hypothetical protein
MWDKGLEIFLFDLIFDLFRGIELN